MRRLHRNLTVQVLAAIGIAIALGLVSPSTARAMKPVGDTFVNLVKMIITPVIFLTIVLGIAGMRDLKQVGRVGGKALLYFEIVTTFALGIGLLVVNLTRPGDGLDVYVTMALFIFVLLNAVLRAYGFSLWHYLRYIREEILIVLGTSSSEAALPRMLDKMERYGCAKPIVGLVIPAGYSFNLDGTSIYLSMATIFIAQAFHVPLTITQQLSVLGVLMLTSKGAAGVTGSGFIVLASTLAAMRVVPVEGVAILLGVDRYMSEARAITNLIGNGAATLVIARSENAFDDALRERTMSETPATRVAGVSPATPA